MQRRSRSELSPKSEPHYEAEEEEEDTSVSTPRLSLDVNDEEEDQVTSLDAYRSNRSSHGIGTSSSSNAKRSSSKRAKVHVNAGPQANVKDLKVSIPSQAEPSGLYNDLEGNWVQQNPYYQGMHHDGEDDSKEHEETSYFGSDFVKGCGCKEGNSFWSCSRQRWLCLNLRKEPLPEISEGFWGTSLVKKIRFGDRFRKVFGPWLLGLMTCIILGGFLWIAYIDYMGFSEDDRPTPITCTAKYWSNSSKLDDTCGVGGYDCRPFESDTWYTLRCPDHCLVDYSTPVYGSDVYTATSRICAAAIHAGVIEAKVGGCFELRMIGADSNFTGSTQNGVTSESFDGWFPRNFEVRVSENQQCNAMRKWMDVYVAFALIFICIILQPDGWYLVVVLSCTGYLYLVTEYRYYDSFAEILNERSTRLLVIFLMALCLWPQAIKVTVPDPRKFPIDALLFYCAPFWFGVHLDMFENIGIDTTLSSGGFDSAGAILGIALIIGIGVPLIFLQVLMFYRAELLPKVIFYVLVVAVLVVVFSVATSNYLTIHLHHFMFGGLGVLLCQGQPRLRYSIMLQAGLLGVLVNGVTVWDIAPLYDTVSDSSSESVLMFWSQIDRVGFDLEVQWASDDVVFNDWKCSQSGLEEFIVLYGASLEEGQNISLAQTESDTIRNGELLDSSLKLSTNSSSTALRGGSSSSNQDDQPFDTIIEDGDYDAYNNDRRLADDYDEEGDDSVPLLVPSDSQPRYRIAVNSVIFQEEFYLSDAILYNATLTLNVPGSTFYITVGNSDTYTGTIPFTMPENATALDSRVQGAGIYDLSAADFSDPCNRVYALLLAERGILPTI